MILNTLFDRLNHRLNFIVQSPWIGTVGNCAEEIYFGLLKAIRDNKKVLFVFPFDLFWIFYFSKKKTGVNRALLHLESEYRLSQYTGFLTVISSISLTLIFCTIRIFAVVAGKILRRPVHDNYITPSIGQDALWNPSNVKEFSAKIVKDFNWKDQVHRPLNIKLPDKMSDRSKILTERMGLPKDSWFVCLHVREGGFYNYHEGKVKSIRNCDIFNYLDAIKLITSSGGWVVRMGDKTMKRLPKMKNVIDYPHTSYKSDALDIFLIQECSFYIGTQSGIWDVAVLYQKPIVMTNMFEWLLGYPLRVGDLGIMKHIFVKSENRYLSVSECFDAFERDHYGLYHNEDYEFHENSSDEIYSIVKEYLDSREDTVQTELQLQCNSKRFSSCLRAIDSIQFSEIEKDNILNKYRFASRLYGCSGTLGQRFLENYWHRDS